MDLKLALARTGGRLGLSSIKVPRMTDGYGTTDPLRRLFSH